MVTNWPVYFFQKQIISWDFLLILTVESVKTEPILHLTECNYMSVIVKSLFSIASLDLPGLTWFGLIRKRGYCVLHKFSSSPLLYFLTCVLISVGYSSLLVSALYLCAGYLFQSLLLMKRVSATCILLCFKKPAFLIHVTEFVPPR